MKVQTGLTSSIKVLSIHDTDEPGCLSFDLVDILQAIEVSVQQYVWLVAEIECTGASVPTRTVISFEQLIQHARHIGQMINGAIVGWPANAILGGDFDLMTQIRHFPGSQAMIAIVAVDSSFFEIVSKDQFIVKQIENAFHDVRTEDPTHYFTDG